MIPFPDKKYGIIYFNANLADLIEAGKVVVMQ